MTVRRTKVRSHSASSVRYFVEGVEVSARGLQKSVWKTHDFLSRSEKIGTKDQTTTYEFALPPKGPIWSFERSTQSPRPLREDLEADLTAVRALLKTDLDVFTRRAALNVRQLLLDVLEMLADGRGSRPQTLLDMGIQLGTVRTLLDVHMRFGTRIAKREVSDKIIADRNARVRVTPEERARVEAANKSLLRKYPIPAERYREIAE